MPVDQLSLDEYVKREEGLDDDNLTPERLDQRYKAREAQNEESRAMAMAEIPWRGVHPVNPYDMSQNQWSREQEQEKMRATAMNEIPGSPTPSPTPYQEPTPIPFNVGSYPGNRGGYPRPAPPPLPSPSPGQLPSPPYEPEGWYGKNLRDIVGLTDEQIEEIKRHPGGMKALAQYANWAIMLTPGMGGKRQPGVPKSPKVPQPGLKVPDTAPRYEGPPEPSMYDPGWAEKHAKQFPHAKAIEDKFGGIGPGSTKQWHELSPEVQQYFQDEIGITDPGEAAKAWNESLKSQPEPKPGSKEWFEKNDDYIKNMLNAPKPPPTPGTPEWDQYLNPYKKPDTPAQKNAERLRQLKQAQSDYLESLKKGPHSEDDAAAWKHYIEEELGGTLPTKPNWAKDHLPKKKLSPEQIKELNKIDTPEEYWKKYHEMMGNPPKKGEKPDIGGFKPPPGEEGPNLLVPGEKVGPVDWDWYNPVGGKNPPYQPPFEVPPSWNDIDLGGPHSHEWWERWHYKPPPDPNSPDFPGLNRWDWTPPPEGGENFGGPTPGGGPSGPLPPDWIL